MEPHPAPGNSRKPSNEPLRSEKIQKLLDSTPSALLIWSIAVSSLIIALLILTITLIPYPYSQGESILCHLLLNLNL